MKRLLFFAGVSLLMAACSGSPTAPSAQRKAAPSDKASLDFTCRSGYIVAYDENGNPYCVPDGSGLQGQGRPRP